MDGTLTHTRRPPKRIDVKIIYKYTDIKKLGNKIDECDINIYEF